MDARNFLIPGRRFFNHLFTSFAAGGEDEWVCQPTAQRSEGPRCRTEDRDVVAVGLVAAANAPGGTNTLPSGEARRIGSLPPVDSTEKILRYSSKIHGDRTPSRVIRTARIFRIER